MTGRKVVVIGSDGMLGSLLVEHLPYRYIAGLGRDVNITDAGEITDRLLLEKPDVIIHVAAYTDVDGCELDKDRAYKTNVLGTKYIADYCSEEGTLLVYLSSTGVYGENKHTRYTEGDIPTPTTVHHKTKLEGEKIVKESVGNYLIIRTGWIYGGSGCNAKNFVLDRYREALKSRIIYSDNSQIGNPTYVKDLIKQIVILIDKGLYGVFNCVNNAKNISRYDYVSKIVELFDLNCSVLPAPKSFFKRVAPVSRNESADNLKLNELGINVMPNWDDSLSSYIEKYRDKCLQGGVSLEKE